MEPMQFVVGSAVGLCMLQNQISIFRRDELDSTFADSSDRQGLKNERLVLKTSKEQVVGLLPGSRRV